MSVAVPLEDRVRQSSWIVKAKVINKTTYKAEGNIFTLNKLEILVYLKGNISNREFAVITVGGVLENEAQITYPALQLNINDVYLFFLEDDNLKDDNKIIRQQNNNLVQAFTYADGQGAVIYQFEKYIDALAKYKADESTFFSKIEALTGIKPITPNGEEYIVPISNTFQNRLQGITAITTFSPNPTNAGTIVPSEFITISGSGFGAGAGTVFYSNANDGGATYTASGVASDNVSWSDINIVNKVASNAGTGPININGSITSGSNLTIDYSHWCVNSSFASFGATTRQRFYHRNIDGAGGYTFKLSTNIFSDVAAIHAAKRAMSTWTCATQINWRIDTLASSSVTVMANDGENTILYEALPVGVLARATTRFQGSATGACNTSNTVWWASEIDVQINNPPATGYTWQKGPAAPSGSQFDLESLLLHEFGHAHGLGHVNNNLSVMYFQIANGVTKRTLLATDIEGGQARIDYSTVASCFNPAGSGTPMIPSIECMQLPVELILFDAKSIDNIKVNLSWTTLSETNNDYFSIERSHDAIHFDSIGYVLGNGNSNIENNYTFVDEKPYQGISYYRLKQVDFDETFTYSDIKKVVLKNDIKNNAAYLYPNPAINKISVILNAIKQNQAQVQLIGISGKLLLNKTINITEGFNQHDIDISNLSRGIYFVKIISDDIQTKLKFTK